MRRTCRSRPSFIRTLLRSGAVAFLVGIGTAAQARPMGQPERPSWEGKTPQALQVMTYDVFARHGRAFGDPAWQGHFAEMGWYRADPSYSDERLTDADHVLLRRLLRERLKHAGPGKPVDRPLFQVERAYLGASSIPSGGMRTLAIVAGLNLFCVGIFIVWRRGRLPALAGFIVTAVLFGRGYAALRSVRSDTERDVAHLVQGALREVRADGETQHLVLDGLSYAYRGAFPFRPGEVITLAVSASGTVLSVNGNPVVTRQAKTAPAVAGW